MGWYAIFILLRVLVTLFFLMTSTYSILNYSPFVFHQFIRPRVFWWVNQFVAWHYAWYCGAYALSVITVLPDVLRRKAGDSTALLTRRLALAYIVVFGLVAEWLVVTPYLPKLWNDRRSFVAALLSFLPIVSLAIVDHIAAWPVRPLNETRSPSTADHARAAHERAPVATTDQRRLLAACLLTAGYLWFVHFVWAWHRTSADTGTTIWLFDAVWALSLSVMAAMVFYAVTNGIIALAGATRAPRAWEYALAVALAAVAIAGVLMTIVFPTIAFGSWEPPTLSIVGGVALAFAWSGVALRRPRAGRVGLNAGTSAGLDLLMAPLIPQATWLCALALVLLPLATLTALSAVERADWNFLAQKLTVVVEWALTFGVIFGITRRMAPRPWSLARLVAPPALVLLTLLSVARLSPQLLAWTGDSGIEAEVSLDRYAGADLSFRLLYDGLVDHPGRDTKFYQYLQMNTSVPTTLDLTPPDVRFSSPLSETTAPRPHVFLFVLDSIRRDYLSPFNPAVTFTPNIARFASENFAFQNAFTRYGGTMLAVPSIWSGGLVLHRLYMPNFQRSDALEKLLDVDHYRWYMGLDSIMSPLILPHPDLVQLDRERVVMQYDFCRTMGELEEQLTARTDGRPAFAFTLSQNLHIANRQHGAVPPGEHYPGFFEPYAAEIHRVDRCFGEFLSYLRQHHLYDDSIIVLTTDHGDSLGEDGNWGHAVTLYPEVVRIPLVVHIPERLKARVTTDLTRVTFSTDIVPTLYALLGHKTDSLGPLFGSPLFVAPDVDLRPRGDGSFLLASSYAATYGMLRHNGRSLYIADLVNGREYAYDLTSQPLGARVPVTDEVRDLNQRLMREQVGELAALYHYVARP